MNSDIVQTLEPQIEHLRYARDRLWIQHAVAHNPKTPSPLSNQHVAIWQEGERPWARSR